MIPLFKEWTPNYISNHQPVISQFFYLRLAIDVPWFSLSIDVVYVRHGVAFTIS